MATGSQLGSLYVRIGADTTGLEQGIARAKGSLSGIAPAARAAVTAMAGVAAGVAAAGVAMTAMVSSAAKSAREITSLAQVANTSAKDFQGLAFAAKSVGIEQEKFADILKDVNDRIGDFRSTGAGPMADFFEQIAPKVGLTAEAFRNLSGPEALQLYYDSLVKAGAAQEDLTFYMEQMASDSTKLIPLLANGGEEFRRLAEQAEALGVVLSDVQRENLLQFDQAMSAIGGTIEGLKNQLAASLAPALTQVAGRLLNFAIEVRKGETAVDELSGAAVDLGSSTELQDWIYAVGIGIARLADALVGIGKTIGAVHSSFKVVAADIQSLLGSFAEDKSGISDWINPDEAEKRRKELEKVLNERNRTLEEANAKWADLWNYKGNRFEEAWQNAFNGPVELPPLTVFGSSGGGGLQNAGKGSEDAAKERDRLKTALKELERYTSTASQIEISEAAERQSKLAEIFQAGVIERGKFYTLQEKLAAKHAENMASIADSTANEDMRRNQQQYEDGIISYQEYLSSQQRLISEHQALLTEIELQSYQDRLEALDELYSERQDSDQEKRDAELALAQDHQDRLSAIEQQGVTQRNKLADQERSKRVAVMDGMLGNLASLMDSGNKKMFQIGKVAAISRALLSGYEAVTQAYRVGTEIGGPVVGAAFAATAAAATAAQIASIRNVQFGGGGSPSSGYSKPSDAVAGGPAQPVQQQKAESAAVTINLQGDRFDQKSVRELIDQINEAVGDGARLRVA